MCLFCFVLCMQEMQNMHNMYEINLDSIRNIDCGPEYHTKSLPYHMLIIQSQFNLIMLQFMHLLYLLALLADNDVPSSSKNAWRMIFIYFFLVKKLFSEEMTFSLIYEF